MYLIRNFRREAWKLQGLTRSAGSALLRKHRTCRRLPLLGPLGSAGALETAARARSAPPGRSKWPLEPARLRLGARNGRSSPLGFAGALEKCRSNSLGSARPLEIAQPGSSKTLHLPTFLKSKPLGSAGALDIGARARSAPLDRRPFTGQDHECLLRSTHRRTCSVHGMHGSALVCYI